VVRRTQTFQGVEQKTYAVRVLATDANELRPLLSLNKQESTFISSRLKYTIGPLPIGLEAEQVLQVVSHLNWPCRFLVPQPRKPDSYIVAAETPPPQTTLPFKSHDVHILPLPDRWSRDQPRSKSIEPQRYQHKQTNLHDRVSNLENLLQEAISKTHLQVQDMKSTNAKNIAEQQRLNTHVQSSINVLQERQDIVQQELLQTRDFFKQQMDCFSATILERIDAQNKATASQAAVASRLATKRKEQQQGSRAEMDAEDAQA
jgi:hypothetical protein